MIDVGSMGAGGITGSTINIAIHGKRNATAAPVVDSPPVEGDLPSVEAPVGAPADSDNHHNVHIDASGADGGIHNSTLNINLINTGKSRRATSPAAHLHQRSHTTASTAWMSKRMLVQPVKRQAGFVTDLEEQVAAYEEGVAALSESLVMPTPTARTYANNAAVGAVKLPRPLAASPPAPVAPRPTTLVPVVVPVSTKHSAVSTKVTLVPAATGLGYFSNVNPKATKSRYIPSPSLNPKFPIPSSVAARTAQTTPAPQAALDPQEWRIVSTIRA